MALKQVHHSKREIAEIAQSVRVGDYIDHCAYLADVYKALKEKFDPYSYIHFAEDLGFGTTNMLRLIIVGERPLTGKTARKIAASIGLIKKDRKYFILLAEYSSSYDPIERDRIYQDLLDVSMELDAGKDNSFISRYFSAWYNPIIRELSFHPGFDPDPKWIQKTLNFPLNAAKIKNALTLLRELGVLYDPAQKEKASMVKTVPFTSEIALARYHQKMLEMSREAITRVDEKDREITALTVSLPKSSIAIVREKISALMDELEAMETKEDSEVFQFNVQYFPCTKLGDE